MHPLLHYIHHKTYARTDFPNRVYIGLEMWKYPSQFTIVYVFVSTASQCSTHTHQIDACERTCCTCSQWHWCHRQWSGTKRLRHRERAEHRRPVHDTKGFFETGLQHEVLHASSSRNTHTICVSRLHTLNKIFKQNTLLFCAFCSVLNCILWSMQSSTVTMPSSLSSNYCTPKKPTYRTVITKTLYRILLFIGSRSSQGFPLHQEFSLMEIAQLLGNS